MEPWLWLIMEGRVNPIEVNQCRQGSPPRLKGCTLGELEAVVFFLLGAWEGAKELLVI